MDEELDKRSDSDVDGLQFTWDYILTLGVRLIIYLFDYKQI